MMERTRCFAMLTVTASCTLLVFLYVSMNTVSDVGYTDVVDYMIVRQLDNPYSSLPIVLDGPDSSLPLVLDDPDGTLPLILDDPDGSLPLVYTPPAITNITTPGNAFNVDVRLLKDMGLPPNTFFQLDNSSVKDFVFVTANDQSHFVESTAAISSVQEMFPGYQIHYYDLGLLPEQITQLKTWCNVTYRTFQLSRYPKHVSRLDWKCWKPLVIQCHNSTQRAPYLK